MGSERVHEFLLSLETRVLSRWRSKPFFTLTFADVGGGKRWRSRRHLEVRMEKQFFPTFIKRDTAHNKNAEFLFSSDGQTARLGNLRSGTWRDMGEDWKIENCQSYQNCRYEYIYAFFVSIGGEISLIVMEEQTRIACSSIGTRGTDDPLHIHCLLFIMVDDGMNFASFFFSPL